MSDVDDYGPMWFKLTVTETELSVILKITNQSLAHYQFRPVWFSFLFYFTEILVSNYWTLSLMFNLFLHFLWLSVLFCCTLYVELYLSAFWSAISLCGVVWVNFRLFFYTRAMCEFKVKFLDTFNANFFVVNLQTSVGKLKLSRPTFLTHDASDSLIFAGLRNTPSNYKKPIAQHLTCWSRCKNARSTGLRHWVAMVSLLGWCRSTCRNEKSQM